MAGEEKERRVSNNPFWTRVKLRARIKPILVFYMSGKGPSIHCFTRTDIRSEVEQPGFELTW